MKSTIKTTFLSALVAGTALVSVASTATAGGFSVREQSTEGQGASFAGIAAGGADLSSMFFNPATITLHEGNQAELDASLILPHAKAKNGINLAPGPLPAGTLGGSSSGNIGKLALVPSNYASYQVNDNLFVGLTANSPFGLVTKGNGTWAGSFHGIKSELFTIQAGPTIGYKINDMIALGGAFHVVYTDVELTQNAGALGVATLKGKDWAYNYSLGILLSPTDSTRIGVGYNSQTEIKFNGSLNFQVAHPLLGASHPITANLTTPGTLTVGVRQQIGENFTALVGFEWADWSKLKNLNAISKLGAGTVSFTDFSWKDSFMYSIGGEYKLGDATTLRAGFAFEKSPVPDFTRGVRVPDNDRYWLSVGASHQVNENFRVSMAYTHIIVKDGKVNLPFAAPTPGIQATFKQHVDIISVSGTYNLDSLFH